MLQAQAGMSKLDALSMIETGDNDHVIGKAGEVSRYQLMPKVWQHYTQSRSFANVDVAKRIAAKHLDALESKFRERTGREPTDFDRYVLWNAGESYYSRNDFQAARVHPVIRERANRFVNLRQMTEHAPMLALNGGH